MALQRYHRVAIYLHWSIAFLIITNLAIGLLFDSRWVEQMETTMRYGMYQWHKTLGILVLLLSIVRLYWRMTHRPPPLPEAMPFWERKIASVGHLGLYAFMFAIPLSGWLLVSASTLNIPTLMFGVIPWPHLPIKSLLTDQGAFAKNMSELHELFAWSLLILLAGHIIAAFRHSLWLKDDVMKRMLPLRKTD